MSGKRLFYTTLLLLISISLIFTNTIGVPTKARAAVNSLFPFNAASTSTVRISIAATDGDGHIVNNDGSTSSTFIKFTASASADDSIITRLECKLLDSGSDFSTCATSSSATSFLSTNDQGPRFTVGEGKHTFSVRAITTDGTSLSPEGSFTWTITTNSIRQATADLASLQSQQATAQAATTQAQQNAQAANIASLVSTAQTASQLASSLNPPWQACPASTDVAVYNMFGIANLKKLLQHAGQNSVPLIIELLTDTIPADRSNLITTGDNPFITARAIAYPGTKAETIINVLITKLSTECKTTALIDKTDVKTAPQLSSQPPVIPSNSPLLANLKPPWIQCTVANPIGTPPPAAAGVHPTSVTQAIKNAQIQALANPTNVGNASSTASAAATSALLQKAQSATGTAQTVPDVAKFVISGRINIRQLGTLGDHDKVRLSVFQDLAALALPETKAFRIESNQLIAANLQKEPGGSNWALADFPLKEISTNCDTIPFVNKPMSIGANSDVASDLATTVVTQKFKQTR